jgi:SAM-dependent methyltransferase
MADSRRLIASPQSRALFDAMAPEYDALFGMRHRAAYDQLAAEFVEPLLPKPPGLVIDVGCGTGRWAERLVKRGNWVLGIEPSREMAKGALERRLGSRFGVAETVMEEVDLPEASAGLVLALGSLQYSSDPERMIRRFAAWTRAGGSVCVLVDSCLALVVELIGLRKNEEAFTRLHTRRAVFRHGAYYAEHHLLDGAFLEKAFRSAGLASIRVGGLLVGMTILGREKLLDELEKNWDRQLDLEWDLVHHRALADLGKHLIISGRKPPTTARWRPAGRAGCRRSRGSGRHRSLRCVTTG